MKTNKSKRRRFVTLMEMLLVLVILSLIAGVVGINIVKSVREQKFRSEVQLVLDQLRLAQDLMLITGIDVHLKFKQTSKGIEYWMETSKQLSKNWSREIERSHKELTTIRFVEFEDGLKYPTLPGEIDIKFLSNGDIMSYGSMLLSTSASIKDLGALERYVCLRGYPAPLVATNEFVECNKDEAEQDETLTNEMIKDINGKAFSDK